MSKGYLTTHVLDTYNGKPGSRIKGSIYIFEEGNRKKIKEFTLKDRKSTRLNSSHSQQSRMPSSA